MQRLIASMDSMNLDAFVYPGWGNPPRLIGDLSQAGNTPLGTQIYLCMFSFAAHACLLACPSHCQVITTLSMPLDMQVSIANFGFVFQSRHACM